MTLRGPLAIIAIAATFVGLIHFAVWAAKLVFYATGWLP